MKFIRVVIYIKIDMTSKVIEVYFLQYLHDDCILLRYMTTFTSESLSQPSNGVWPLWQNREAVYDAKSTEKPKYILLIRYGRHVCRGPLSGEITHF